MDYLKTQAPFWKKEHRPDGSSGDWVEAKESDDEAVPPAGKNRTFPDGHGTDSIAAECPRAQEDAACSENLRN